MLLPFLAALGPDEPADPPPPRNPPPEPDASAVAPVPAPGGAGGTDYVPEHPPVRRALAHDRMDTEDDELGDVPYDTASLPPDHPAYDRVQNRRGRTREAPRRSRFLGVLTAIALVAAGLLITYALLRPDPAPADVQDLLQLIAVNAAGISLDVATSDLDEAEEFIIGEFGWPIRVPVLPNARLEGAGVDALVEGVEVPVLLYRTDDGAPVVVYAYDYAFLDAAANRLRLAPPVYARLADTPPVDVRRVGDQYLVLWRRRAAIYTAVTADDPGPLVEYLQRR